MRQSLGKSAVVVDMSMVAVKDDDSDATAVEPAAEAVSAQGRKGERVGDKAFDDETDLRNEDFIFVY
jgi:hypothetical protein